MRDLVSHLEHHLGPIESGWSESRTGDPLGVTVAKFPDAPVSGASAYCTLGMSAIPLSLDGRRVQHELLGACWAQQFVPEFAGLLAEVALQVTDRAVALRRGEVLSFGAPLFAATDARALYCTQPVYFPRELAVWRGSSPPTVIVWLVPIHASEAGFVAREGWEAFEDLMQQKDPDLLDLRRAPLLS